MMPYVASRRSSVAKRRYASAKPANGTMIALGKFGISFIEVTSGSVLLWRMMVDRDDVNRERNEKLSLKIVGVAF